MAKGADVNAQDQWGDTALLIAAGSGFYHLVPLLLAQENIDIEARGDNGWTPLIAAAWAGWDDVVQMLLDAGANINAQASNRKTALMWAAQHGYDDVVRLLIQRGADLKFLIGRTRQL